MKGEQIKGYLYGTLTALCWAISPIFIRRGLEGLPSSIWGTAVGLVVAAGLYGLWFLLRDRSDAPVLISRRAATWQILGGLASGLGILFRNLALDTTQVAIVIALAQGSALFTLLFGPLLLAGALRERITPRIVFGVFAILAGSGLIILGRTA